MPYDPAHKDAYEQNETLQRILLERARELNEKLRDSMDSIAFDTVLWTAEGARFSLKTIRLPVLEWHLHGQSDVALTPTEIELIVSGKVMDFEMLNEHHAAQHREEAIRAFRVAFDKLDPAALRVLASVIKDLDASNLPWEYAMKHVVLEWDAAQNP